MIDVALALSSLAVFLWVATAAAVVVGARRMRSALRPPQLDLSALAPLGNADKIDP